MKFNFFKRKKQSQSSKKDEGLDHLGSTKAEIAKYDQYVNFYYTNLINSLILFTYNTQQLDALTPVLIDPLNELYEELQYAFTPVCFETIFRNKKIDSKFKEELLSFKSRVEELPTELWNWELLDENENWKHLKIHDENLLDKLGITSRIFNDEFITIMLSN